MTPEQRKQKFLEKYAALVVEYGMIFDGCGCCGSPYITTQEAVEENAKRFGEKSWQEFVTYEIKTHGEDPL